MKLLGHMDGMWSQTCQVLGLIGLDERQQGEMNSMVRSVLLLGCHPAANDGPHIL